jgi:hypothetical protein
MGLQSCLALPRLPVSLLALAPVVVVVVVPTAYVAHVLRQAARRTTASASISPPDALPLKSKRGKGKVGVGVTGRISDEQRELESEGGDVEVVIPPAVLARSEAYVIARERVVSEAVPLESILPWLRSGLAGQDRGEEMGSQGVSSESGSERERERERGLLETYLGTTMRMFSWTPQAVLMKLMVSRLPDGERFAETFSAAYLDACRFEVGDRACGIWVVREHVGDSDAESTGQRVILDLSPPNGWKGPVVRGALDCGFVTMEGGGRVRFVNETVLWRQKDEKPTVLEGKFGRWMHTLMVGWLVIRGVEAVTGVVGGKRVKDKES